MMNKKAVSPLIATVLLIAFAVALGAIVMNWGESFVRETQNTASEASEGRLDCTMKVDFDVINAEYYEDDTNDNHTLTILVRNAGDKEIEEFVAQLFTNTTRGGKAVYNSESENYAVIRSLDVKEIIFEVNVTDIDNGLIIGNVSNLTEVRIIPRIDTGAPTGPVSCTNKYVTVSAEDMAITEE